MIFSYLDFAHGPLPQRPRRENLARINAKGHTTRNKNDTKNYCMEGKYHTQIINTGARKTYKMM